jgi:hypothetical protein
MAGLAGAYAAGFGVADLIQIRLSGVVGLAAAMLLGTCAYLIVGIGIGGTTHRDRDRLRSVLARFAPRGIDLAERLELT